MLLQTVARSSFIICFMILCIRNTSSAYILDGRKCLVYEDVVTDSPEIQVEDVQTVTFNKHISDRTEVKYGQHIKLICDIYQPSLINIIKWKGRFRELTNGISTNHTVLDIKSVNMEYHGEYITCEASMVSTSKLVEIYGTHIMINDLAPPLISELTPNNVTVTENDKTTLSCKIVAGVPPPQVSWQVKRTGDDEFKDLPVTSEDYTVNSTSFADDGQYRCFAKNVRGEANKTIDIIVQKLPVVVIEEGTAKTFPYGNTSEFTCRIKGYPMPVTVWEDSQGNKLDSEDTEINWHEKISKLKLQYMKKSNNYSCFADSSLGKVVRNVNVTVLSPFAVHNYPKETINVHFAASTNILCNITASFPMRIKWFRPKTANSSEQSEIHTDQQFKITSDESILQIVSMEMDLAGNYTCKASLASDENETIAYTTDVQIDDLAPPSLSHTNKIIVMETNMVTLFCKIIGGVPIPTLSWQVMRYGDSTYVDLLSSSEELDIDNITIADAGRYRCLAKNALGEWSKDTEVLVRKAPVLVIDEGSAVSVAYGSNNTFTCRVLAYPQPTIVWEDATGNVLMSEETMVSAFVKTSNVTVYVIRASTFHCHANNSMGQDASSISLIVRSPFIVHQKPEDTTNVHYKASTNLVCNITSSFPMKIKWYHNSTEVHTSSRQIISANETVLHISTMELDLQGSYRCEATLVSDDSQKKIYITNVKIDNLRPPTITHYNGPAVTVKNFEELNLICNAMGYPDPIVTWQGLLPGSSSYSNLGTGASLCSTNFGFAQAGTYRCTASNIAGVDSRTINVAVY